MASLDRVRFAAFDQLVRGVGAGGVEQPIARGRIACTHRDERFRNQTYNGRYNLRTVNVIVRGDRAGRFEGEDAGEYREPAEN